jgi:hypothetical protein
VLGLVAQSAERFELRAKLSRACHYSR